MPVVSAAVLLLVLLVAVLSVLWDGFASYDANMPGAPHSIVDGEQ